jgi:hypothetical protein
MSTDNGTGQFRAVEAMARAARVWGVDVTQLLVGDDDATSHTNARLTAHLAKRTRVRSLAASLMDLTADEGCATALEAIERGLMAMATLLPDSRKRAALRSIAANLVEEAKAHGLW